MLDTIIRGSLRHRWAVLAVAAVLMAAGLFFTARLPVDVVPDLPALGPISSIMGEISFIALTSDSVGPMELRRLAETVVRRSLLAVPGISQVVPIGGELRG